MTCEHPAILFYRINLTFRCEKCGDSLVKLNGMEEFRLFCEFAGKDPNKLLA